MTPQNNNLTWKDIEEKFDEKMQIAVGLDEFLTDKNRCVDFNQFIKSFLREKLERVMEEMVGEEDNRGVVKMIRADLSEELGVSYGYNQKRQELIDFKKSFFK